MPHFYLTDQEHRQALALVRRMELRPGGMEWSSLLDALETDRPRNVTPIASRRADVDERLAKAQRVTRLERLGLDTAMEEANRG